MTPFSSPLFIVISDRTQNIYIAASYHDLSNNSVAYIQAAGSDKMCVLFLNIKITDSLEMTQICLPEQW